MKIRLVYASGNVEDVDLLTPAHSRPRELWLERIVGTSGEIFFFGSHVRMPNGFKSAETCFVEDLKLSLSSGCPVYLEADESNKFERRERRAHERT